MILHDADADVKAFNCVCQLVALRNHRSNSLTAKAEFLVTMGVRLWFRCKYQIHIKIPRTSYSSITTNGENQHKSSDSYTYTHVHSSSTQTQSLFNQHITYACIFCGLVGMLSLCVKCHCCYYKMEIMKSNTEKTKHNKYYSGLTSKLQSILPLRPFVNRRTTAANWQLWPCTIIGQLWMRLNFIYIIIRGTELCCICHIGFQFVK